MVDDDENVGKVSTEEQRKEVSKLANEAEDWMYDDGYNVDLRTMEAKYLELATPADKIFFRVAELTARPAAVAALKEKLEKVEELMTKCETTHPQITEVERNDVLAKIEEAKTWLTEKEAEQEKVALPDDPAFNSSQVPLRTKSVESMVSRLSKKPKHKPPKSNETKAEDDTKAKNETIVRP